jgi:hypothetical protein
MWGRKQRRLERMCKALHDVYWANDPNDQRLPLTIDRIVTDALNELTQMP